MQEGTRKVRVPLSVFSARPSDEPNIEVWEEVFYWEASSWWGAGRRERNEHEKHEMVDEFAGRVVAFGGVRLGGDGNRRWD